MLKKRNLDKFLRALVKLNTQEFIGVVKMMGIALWDGESVDDEQKPILKSGEALIEEMAQKFQGYNRVRRRNLMSIIEAAGRKGE